MHSLFENAKILDSKYRIIEIRIDSCLIMTHYGNNLVLYDDNDGKKVFRCDTSRLTKARVQFIKTKNPFIPSTSYDLIMNDIRPIHICILLDCPQNPQDIPYRIMCTPEDSSSNYDAISELKELFNLIVEEDYERQLYEYQKRS